MRALYAEPRAVVGPERFPQLAGWSYYLCTVVIRTPRSPHLPSGSTRLVRAWYTGGESLRPLIKNSRTALPIPSLLDAFIVGSPTASLAATTTRPRSSRRLVAVLRRRGRRYRRGVQRSRHLVSFARRPDRGRDHLAAGQSLPIDTDRARHRRLSGHRCGRRCLLVETDPSVTPRPRRNFAVSAVRTGGRRHRAGRARPAAAQKRDRRGSWSRRSSSDLWEGDVRSSPGQGEARASDDSGRRRRRWFRRANPSLAPTSSTSTVPDADADKSGKGSGGGDGGGGNSGPGGGGGSGRTSTP